MADPTRRDIFRLTAGAAIAVPLLAQGTGHLFFTPDQFRLVDELTGMIVPADEHSPGARAAHVAAYIDKSLAEAFLSHSRQIWRDGLTRVDALSKEMHGRHFLECTQEGRVAVLSRMARNELHPTRPEEIFFHELKARTTEAYYTSKIGIHTEMEYKGNVYLDHFVGYVAK